MSKELVNPVSTLTAEELESISFKKSTLAIMEPINTIEKLIISHRNLLSANAELSFENMLRKKYEGFLLSVIRSGEKLNDGEDFEWFKRYMGSTSILSEVFK